MVLDPQVFKIITMLRMCLCFLIYFQLSDDVFITMPDDDDHNKSTNNSNRGSLSTNKSNNSSTDPAPREGILRMLPPDAEGAIAMTAVEDTLKAPIAAFIRLKDPQVCSRSFQCYM